MSKKKISERVQLFLAKFDEINKLGKAWLKVSEDEALSNFEDFLIEGYLLGFAEAKSLLGIKDKELNPYIHSPLSHSYLGVTVGKKFSDYFKEEDTTSMARLMDSEYHRNFNYGMFEAANDAQWKHKEVKDEFGNVTYEPLIPSNKKIVKKWVTMGDEKVRDTHEFLNGVKVDLHERFYTYDGDSAMFPSDFQLASNNTNCRCVLSFSLADRPIEEPTQSNVVPRW